MTKTDAANFLTKLAIHFTSRGLQETSDKLRQAAALLAPSAPSNQDVRRIVALNLDRIMDRRDITAIALSRMTGIDDRTICDARNEKRYIQLDRLEIIARALQVPISYFFEEARSDT